jgi:hypothetical protein
MVSGHKNKHRQTRQELNEKRRLRRAKKALDAEAKGLRKRRLNLRTRELLHKANGKPLAKEMLEAAMINGRALPALLPARRAKQPTLSRRRGSLPARNYSGSSGRAS